MSHGGGTLRPFHATPIDSAVGSWAGAWAPTCAKWLVIDALTMALRARKPDRWDDHPSLPTRRAVHRLFGQTCHDAGIANRWAPSVPVSTSRLRRRSLRPDQGQTPARLASIRAPDGRRSRSSARGRRGSVPSTKATAPTRRAALNVREFGAGPHREHSHPASRRRHARRRREDPQRGACQKAAGMPPPPRRWLWSLSRLWTAPC